MSRRTTLTWDTLPLFASDEELGEALLGRDRRSEFHGLAMLHEPDGMPKIDPVWGGRYVPAVKAFFDAHNGLSPAVPFVPNGVEGNFHHDKPKRTQHGSKVAKETDRATGPVLVR
jgi:hypothetical protein